MKIMISILSLLLGSFTISAMQQPAKKYSDAASEKLMKILKNSNQYKSDQLRNEVISALHEGANPNYIEQYTFPIYEGYRSRSGLRFYEIDEQDTLLTLQSGQTVITTPLNEAIRWRNKDIISILLKAGANPDLRNILKERSPDVPNPGLKTAREIAQENGVELFIIPTQKLK